MSSFTPSMNLPASFNLSILPHSPSLLKNISYTPFYCLFFWRCTLKRRRKCEENLNNASNLFSFQTLERWRYIGVRQFCVGGEKWLLESRRWRDEVFCPLEVAHKSDEIYIQWHLRAKRRRRLLRFHFICKLMSGLFFQRQRDQIS